MKDQIKKSFDAICADDALKTKSLQAVLKKTRNKKKGNKKIACFIPSIACVAMLCFVLLRIYFTPTIVLAMDINPSIELSVNRFDRVIDATAINDDGVELLKMMNLKHLTYEQAIDTIVHSDVIESMLADKQELEIVVVGNDSEQDRRICQTIEEYSDKMHNVSCLKSTEEELSEARSMGMSCGEYREYCHGGQQTVDENEDAEDTHESTHEGEGHQGGDASHEGGGHQGENAPHEGEGYQGGDASRDSEETHVEKGEKHGHGAK